MYLLLNALSQLRLQSLSADWVESIHSSEFLDFEDIPEEYEEVLESIDTYKVLKDVRKAVDKWMNIETENEEKSWKSLSSLIPHETLLAILAYHIDHGSKNVHNKEYRNNALLASRLYYKLLSIPGYRAYRIYHSQLFVHSLACLNFLKAMCEGDNRFNTRELSKEVDSLIKEMQYFALDLKSVMQQLQLNANDMNFEDILSNLVEVPGVVIVTKLNVDRTALANISMIIYEMIDVLVCDANGQPDNAAIKLLFKSLLPKLVAASVDSRNIHNLARASYVTYCGLLLNKYDKAALSGFTILLEHLCFMLDGLERAEVRTARVTLVAGLMSLLPRKYHRNFVQWLLKLSTTAKVSHRHIALEMLASLLNNDPEEPDPNETPPGQNIDEEQQANQTQLQDSGIELQADETNLQSFTINTDDDSSQETIGAMDNVEVGEAGDAGMLVARAHRVAHAAILRAVCERVHDASSTLRARALHLLADCLVSTHPPIQHAINVLNGTGEVSRLMALGARCVCDERAAVRRAAVGLVHRLLAAAPAPLPADLGILVGLCRDASIIVRSAAIAGMGELVMQKPSEAMFDAFLTGPMNQLSDPENKVQEQVVTLMKQLIVEKIQNHVEGEAEAPHPWLLLAAITRHNMRRHLQKAFTLMAKTANCVNHRLVDAVSTHLGVSPERDLHCLVLLTSVARLFDYSDIRFALDFYYNLTKMMDCDVRVMTLTLELLSVWSRFVVEADRTQLRDFLVERLASDTDDGCRIPTATLAAQLDPSNIDWATELLQISERRALSGAPVEEWVRAADLSLVAKQPPEPALLRTFLAGLQHPPPEWSSPRMGLCVAGVGRLCLRARPAAVRAAPALAALLLDNTAPLTARVNALLSITDICTRYTSIVEPLLDSVAGCLAVGTAPPLRRAASRALTRLMLAGFLRLRPPLYYQYCALLADEDHDVREPAEYYVTSCLTPELIYGYFVDCVILYNKTDSACNPGLSFDARQLIYDVMLQRLSMVQKLNVQCKLAVGVVSHAADVADARPPPAELPAPLHAALLDTITLLCSPRMKLSRKPQGHGDADIEDLQERVTKNIVSHKIKVSVAEEVVPAVLRLYAHLRTRGGQLAAYLVRIATDLLNDYRQEIEELFEDNKELVERVTQFQATIGPQAAGNARNLVTASAPPEPDTPHASRRRPAPSASRRAPPLKRTLRF